MSGFGIFSDALDMIIPTGMLISTDSTMKITSGMVQPTIRPAGIPLIRPTGVQLFSQGGV
jgi:hypothetical protein